MATNGGSETRRLGRPAWRLSQIYEPSVTCMIPQPALVVTKICFSGNSYGTAMKAVVPQLSWDGLQVACQ
jgi:hypothetical protein